MGTTIAFVNVSHPGEVRSRHVQKAIRRHVMKDIGRVRRKRPRAEIIPLEVREQPPVVAAEEAPPFEFGIESSLVSLHGHSDMLAGPAWSLNPSGILGVDLNDRILQIVHFSELLAFSTQTIQNPVPRWANYLQ